MREPMGMDARYKEYLADERNKKRAQMMQNWNIYTQEATPDMQSSLYLEP